MLAIIFFMIMFFLFLSVCFFVGWIILVILGFEEYPKAENSKKACKAQIEKLKKLVE